MFALDEKHPYWHVRSVIGRLESVASLFLSFYVYRPQSLVDQRRTIEVSRNDFLNASFVTGLFRQCRDQEEIAFHSIVIDMSGRTLHLPLVDMATTRVEALVDVNAFLQDSQFSGFVWFESGRSFHGYASELVDGRGWQIAMGKMLLCNPRSGEAIVDPRWIGHRIIAGYAALRWSCNTKQYLSMPSRLQPSFASRTPRLLAGS
ncbi:hypothetical protein ACPWT1_13070 [Ramlibacter sp. MMS24-I3-19]|uniref:primase 1D-like protein n=1 Tax=Ramlibacter sp. MMS24-I3-19 TaxID=3416606 RepID=UPI003D017984